MGPQIGAFVHFHTDQLFNSQQLAEIYRCIHETMDSGYPLTPEREEMLKKSAEQIERAVPNLDELISQSNQRDLEAVGAVEPPGLTQMF